MKIKIGNFNFISENENKIALSYSNLNRNLNYFYLDGKEDTLIVRNDFSSEENYYGMKIPEYEKSLLNKYNIIPLYKEMSKQINKFIENKINRTFENKSYSRYELYKDVNFSTFNNINKTQYKIIDCGNETVYNFDENRIKYGDFIFNPYTLEVENLEEMYKLGKFNDVIKNCLISKEIETNFEPPFVKEIFKISDFLKDKKSVNLYIKNLEPFKTRPKIDSFLKIDKNQISIDLNWEEEKNFKNTNPSMDYRNLQLKDLEKLTYSKKELKIDSENFSNLKYQISKTPEDLLLFRIDELKENIKKEYNDYYRRNRDLDSISNYSFPYYIDRAVNVITEINTHNNQVKMGSLKEDMIDKPLWYTKEVEEILYKNDLISELEQTNDIEIIKDIARELEDKELQQIYYTLKNEEENYTDEDEEETI